MTPRAGADPQGYLPTRFGADNIGGRMLMEKSCFPPADMLSRTCEKCPPFWRPNVAQACATKDQEPFSYFRIPATRHAEIPGPPMSCFPRSMSNCATSLRIGRPIHDDIQ